MAAKGNKRMQKVWRIIKRTLIFLFIFHLFYILILKWVDPPITITQFVSFVTGDGLKRDYVSMDAFFICKTGCYLIRRSIVSRSQWL